MAIVMKIFGSNGVFCALFSISLWAMSSQVQAQSIQCCNLATGDFSALSEEACTAKPGHAPMTGQNMAQIVVCIQKAQELAQEYLGMPSIPNIPGMPDNIAGMQTSETPIPQVECCHASAESFVGVMDPQVCLDKAGHFPDIPDYLEETEICRSSGPGGGGSAPSPDDVEINIENGGFEDWNGDEPVGYMNFDGGQKVAEATKSAGLDMQTVFKSTDAHTGQYSLHLKARKMKLPPNVPAYAQAMVPVQAGGLTSCGDNCASLAAGNPVTESASMTLKVTDPGNYLCGVYKGSFVGGDQLWVNAGIYRGKQLVGGTNSGGRALNFISKNAAQWTEFKLPLTMLPGTSGGSFNRASIELMLKPAGNLRALTMGQLLKVHEGTNVKIDSVRFCGEIGITLFKPEVLGGQEISNEKELSVGAQTFVNLDNDDQSSNFDINDKGMSKDDNELVEMVLTLPIREGGYVNLQLTAPDGAVKIWEDARKTKAFEGLNTPTEVPAYLQEENGQWRKHLWIEGLQASAAQKDLLFKFTYSQTENGPSIESDEVAITILGIEDMEWIGQGNGLEDSDVLDADPNWPKNFPGQSKRVFPGKKVVNGKPGDRAADRVKLQVTLSVAPVETVKIYFRSFDVDDPTSDKDPLDDEAKANDNRGQVPSQTGSFPLGQGDIIEVDFDEIEEEFEFQVTMQPGDNFRVVGNGDRSALMQLENDDAILSKAGPRHGSKIINQYIFKAKESVGQARVRQHEKYVSDVLTVWRYLYTEVDSMAPVFKNFINGTIASFATAGSAENGAPKYVLGLSENIFSYRPSKDGTKGLLNSFQNGRILAGKELLHIHGNTANAAGADDVTVSALPGWGEIDASIIDQKFKITDDDYLNGMDRNDAVLSPIPMDRFAPAYAPAYILPRLGMLNNPKKTVPFIINYYEDGSNYLRSIYAFDNAKYHQDKEFWLAYLLNAFQGIANEDGDGDGTGAIAGQADGPGKGSMGVSIYQESGLELERTNKAAKGWRLMDSVPHETAHLFGGSHEDGGLMAGPDGPKTEDFTDKSLNTIRSADHP